MWGIYTVVFFVFLPCCLSVFFYFCIFVFLSFCLFEDGGVVLREWCMYTVWRGVSPANSENTHIHRELDIDTHT